MKRFTTLYILIASALTTFFIGHGYGYRHAMKELSQPHISICDPNDSAYFRIRSLAGTRRYVVTFSGQFNRKYRIAGYGSTMTMDSAMMDTTVFLPLYEKK